MLEETARLCCALRRLIAAVPADLETGIRLCYGERDGHSFLEQLDSGKAMKFPTLDVERIDRPLNWVHIPVPIGGEDDAHDTPSRVLRLPGGAEPYLRVVHAADGLQVRPTSRSPARVAIGRGKALRQIASRNAVAERFAPKFGIAAECGLRAPAGQMPSSSSSKRTRAPPHCDHLVTGDLVCNAAPIVF